MAEEQEMDARRPESDSPGAPSPSRFGVALYAVVLMSAWGLAALLTRVGIGIWWTGQSWKVGVLSLCGMGMTIWLGVGVWELMDAEVRLLRRTRSCDSHDGDSGDA